MWRARYLWLAQLPRRGAKLDGKQEESIQKCPRQPFVGKFLKFSSCRLESWCWWKIYFSRHVFTWCGWKHHFRSLKYLQSSSQLGCVSSRIFSSSGAGRRSQDSLFIWAIWCWLRFWGFKGIFWPSQLHFPWASWCFSKTWHRPRG